MQIFRRIICVYEKNVVPLQRENPHTMSKRRISLIVFIVSLLVVLASGSYTYYLSYQLSLEEQKKMSIWAEATRQFIMADEETDIDFCTSIIEENTTIPVYMTDAQQRIILSRNGDPKRSDVEDLHGPIEVRISDDIVQYIYYDDSTLLKQLQYFPYIQLTLILLFLVIGLYALITSARSEQNLVWVGLSKETAHQLGTPISSLNAWLELLKATYPDDTMLPQMQHDIDRLGVIADRFSKVGSLPSLEPTAMQPLLADTVQYMRARTSNKIKYILTAEGESVVNLSRPLFVWVIENLIRNAVDAIQGTGEIRITLKEDEENVLVDVSDTGRGMTRREQQHAFQPGFTTKKRGWGLGLSLAKRIVEDYHRGKLFIEKSEIGQGTTFRIILKKAIDS